MSREIQNATDQVTEPVNIADAYDRYRSLNTQWNSSLLLEEKHSGCFHRPSCPAIGHPEAAAWLQSELRG